MHFRNMVHNFPFSLQHHYALNEMWNCRIVCLMMCFWLKLVSAQDPYAISITEVNGLSSNHVYDILQDSKGFMWFATDRGLCRYDGFQFVSFRNKEQLSKSGSNISEDRYGRIWYLNFDGYLLYIENGTLHSLRQNEPIGFVNYAIHDNDLLVIQKHGVDVFDLKTLKIKRKVKHDFRTNYLVGIQVVPDGLLFLGEKCSLMRWNWSWETLHVKRDKRSLPPNLPAIGADGSVFLCFKFEMDNGVYVFDGGDFKRKFRFTTSSSVQSLSATSNAVWACTINGAFSYDWKGNPLNNGHAYFPNQSISKVFEDREHNLWVSSTANGVWLIANKDVSLYHIPDTPGFFIQDGNRTKLVNTKGAFWEFIGSNWVKTTKLDGYNERIERLFYDPVSKTIATSSKSFDLWDYSNKRLKSLIIAVKDFQRLDDRYFLVASSGICGVYENNPKAKSSWSRYFKEFPKHTEFTGLIDLMEGVRVKSICLCDEYGTFYFSTNIGVFCFKKGKITPVFLHGKKIYLNQLVWFDGKVTGLDDNGELFLIEQGRIHEMNVDLPAVRLDKMKLVGSNLFLIGDRNVFRVEKSFRKIKKLDLNLESSDLVDITETSKHIFVATATGVLTFNKRNMTKRQVIPKLELLSIRVNDLPLNDDELMALSYHQNYVEISYAILNFSRGNEFPLHYRINGAPWKLASDQSRQLTFASLEPGSYSVDFMIEGKICKTVRFHIESPWWKNAWFYLIGVLLLSGTMFFSFRRRVKRIQKKNELMTEKILLEKSLKETMLKSVKAQMNPHFFYNSLNTIQSFIFEDDKRNASTYLAKFSTLSRMILEMSEMELVTLDMECRAIRLYMDLEEVRFTEDFTFEFTIDPSLSTEAIRIPPMLIQPYLENAVKHGLLHKKGHKSLRLTIDLSGEKKLKITISDNGIGRFKSAEINQNRHVHHRSFATNANEQRLRLLQRDQDSPTVVYHDLVDEQNESLGTTVEIYIPYE